MLILEIAGGIILAYFALALVGVAGDVANSFAEHRANFPKAKAVLTAAERAENNRTGWTALAIVAALVAVPLLGLAITTIQGH
jgi:hypothetical protein